MKFDWNPEERKFGHNTPVSCPVPVAIKATCMLETAEIYIKLRGGEWV